MTLSRQQFQEWKDRFNPKTDIRVPQSRFYGTSGLKKDVGMEGEELYSAVDYATSNADLVDYPISQLRALHHVNRQNARNVFESIKNKGYDESDPILAVGDEHMAVIINGHHRALAARAAGMKKIPTELVNPGYLEP